MGVQIIEQPDGLLSLFSSNEDIFVATDLTDEGVIDYFVQQAAEDTRRRVSALVMEVRDPEARPYYQFGLTYEEALAMHQETVQLESD